jgi:CubicO group peptidase (beta-lactamase class C family)
MKKLSILLLTLNLFAAAIPLTVKAQELLDTEAIDTYIENFVAENQIPGLALSIVHDNEVVYTQGYGITGPDGTAVTPQTPFALGSVSKPLTALAVMQLVEAGKIDLDAPIQTYLPWFTLADLEEAKQITIRHLLTHTSGFSGMAGSKGMISNDMSDTALEAGIRELADTSLNRPVGQSYAYANPNYDILGLIVQTVSGQSYESYIEDHIFTPLEMANSYTSKAEAEANGMAVGHTYYFGNPTVFDDAPHPRRSLPSGFLISSAEDLGHYLMAHLNEGRYGDVQILSPEYIALMQQPAIEYGNNGMSYALGWRTNVVGGEPSVRHGGDAPNFHGDLAFSSARGWGVAVVINYGGAPMFHILNAPVNEVLRMTSGYDTGDSAGDMTGFLKVVWGFITLMVTLNIVLWGIFYWRRWLHNRPLRLVWHTLLPLALDMVLMWLILVFVPNLLDFTTLSVFLAFAPDLGLILLICGVVTGLTALTRIVVYIAFTRGQSVVPIEQH